MKTNVKPARKPKSKSKPVVCDGFDGQFTKMYGKPFVWSGRKTPA